MEDFINTVLTIVLVFLAFCIVMGLIRAFTGKKPADRMIAVNMITTAVVMMTIILSVLLRESWLPDIAAIYALVSFVAVVVFARLYIIARIRKGDRTSFDDDGESREGGSADGN